MPFNPIHTLEDALHQIEALKRKISDDAEVLAAAHAAVPAFKKIFDALADAKPALERIEAAVGKREAD